MGMLLPAGTGRRRGGWWAVGSEPTWEHKGTLVTMECLQSIHVYMFCAHLNLPFNMISFFLKSMLKKLCKIAWIHIKHQMYTGNDSPPCWQMHRNKHWLLKTNAFMYKMPLSACKLSFSYLRFLWFDNEDKITAKQQNLLGLISCRLYGHSAVQPACLSGQAWIDLSFLNLRKK